MPLINPEQTILETHRDLPSIGYYVILTPIPLAILAASWFLNKEAQRLKPEQNKKQEKHGKLKWVLFGFVVFLVLYAFLV